MTMELSKLIPMLYSVLIYLYVVLMKNTLKQGEFWKFLSVTAKQKVMESHGIWTGAVQTLF